MKNRIFLVSCLILIFISIASVSASENINQTLDITDNGNSDIIGIPASNIDANDTVSLVYDENNIGISNEETAGNVLYVYGIQTGGNDILNLHPGDYIITAEYKGSMVANNIKVLPVLAAEDLTKMYGSQDPFVATLVDGQGKPYANQKIEFNINGVLYYRTTDSSGQAKLNINLMPGEYIITSSYNGSSIANT